LTEIFPLRRAMTSAKTVWQPNGSRSTVNDESENSRPARFYTITRAGKKHLAAETELWGHTVAIVTRMLEHEP
jgi:DNA-binding PadR family transcriptional regulator